MAWINLLDVLYPIGSLYFSNNSTSPASVVGGSWTQISGAAIRGASDAIAGYEGSDTHTITTSEMPSHTHSASGSTGSSGAHAHNMYVKTNAASGSNRQVIQYSDGNSGGEWKWSSSNASSGAHAHSVSVKVNNTGGGQQCHWFNAPTTVLFGIEQHKISPRGDVKWPLGFHYLMLFIPLERFILALHRQVHQVSSAARGQLSKLEDLFVRQVRIMQRSLWAVKHRLRLRKQRCQNIDTTMTLCPDIAHLVQVDMRQLGQMIIQIMEMRGIRINITLQKLAAEMRTKIDRLTSPYIFGGALLKGGVA